MPDQPDDAAARSGASAAFADRWLHSLHETPLLLSWVLDRAGRVLEANERAVAGCGYRRAEVLGELFWQCGWWAADPAVAARVERWCRDALAGSAPLRVRSDYVDAERNRRAIELVLSPVPAEDGEPRLVVTGLDGSADPDRERLRLVEQAQDLAAGRLRQLISATVAMAGAGTIEELVNHVVERAVVVLGADAGMVAVRQDDELLITTSASVAHLPDWRQPLDSDLPMAQVARSGHRLVLPNPAAMRAFSPVAARRYSETNRAAWAFFPLRSGSTVIGSLAVGWRTEHHVPDDEIALLEAFSAQCGQALDRIRRQQAERSAARQVARLAEALQMSLLTPPSVAEGLQIAVRYQPAAEQARIGGDFYDAFVDTDGATVLAVGDVAGHDTAAAAAMAQIRNLLRGQAYSSTDGPAAALRRLDETLSGLDVGVFATAVLARIEAWASDSRRGRQLTWSSAGHPPPMLRLPDGEVVLLDAKPGLLLGVAPETGRWEYAVPVPVGATLLLYTDGLVERRAEDLDDSIEALRRFFGEVGAGSPEQICDAMLTRAGPGDYDDVALLVLRICDTDRSG
ncbi:MAG TPA: SpoIIE family protein phosphatase [Jatrophihabitans sp.]|nr:SpoIIE family protein phosphatase [Jatrophihabitans sp.]